MKAEDDNESCESARSARSMGRSSKYHYENGQITKIPSVMPDIEIDKGSVNS